MSELLSKKNLLNFIKVMTNVTLIEQKEVFKSLNNQEIPRSQMVFIPIIVANPESKQFIKDYL